MSAAITDDQSVVLGPVDVAVKTDEIPMLPVLLDPIKVTNVVLTADAMHAQKYHAEYIMGRGGHYGLTVKGRQPSRHAQTRRPTLERRPSRPLRGRESPRTDRTTHGHRRRILFPHARQAVQITRRIRRARGQKWTTETVHAVTDLTGREAGPYQLASWIRQHWHIENKLHWVRDVTWAEDLTQIRTGNSSQVMASVRNLVISRPPTRRIHRHNRRSPPLRQTTRKTPHTPAEQLKHIEQ